MKKYISLTIFILLLIFIGYTNEFVKYDLNKIHRLAFFALFIFSAASFSKDIGRWIVSFFQEKKIKERSVRPTAPD